MSYDNYLTFKSVGNEICNFYTDCTPEVCGQAYVDIDVGEGFVSFHFFKVMSDYWVDGRYSHEAYCEQISCDYDLKFIEGKLKGCIDVLNYYYASGNSNYKTVKDALEHGRGKVLIDGPDGKKNVYFVKY